MTAQVVVFVDLETGGLDRERHPIIELAAVACSLPGLEVLGRFHALVDFDTATADPEALQMNHFDPLRWAEESVPEDQVRKDFTAFLNRFKTVEQMSKRTAKPFKVARLAGHNLPGFDLPFLQAWFRKVDAFFPASYLAFDTVQLAAWVAAGGSLGEPPGNMKLETVAAWLGCAPEPGAAHSALVDCETTVRCARSLLAQIRSAS